MKIQFQALGITEERLNDLIKLGLKYDKRQKKQMLAAAGATLPTEEDVRKFEEKVGFTIPSDYRNFLLEKNGGIPNKTIISVPNIGEKVVQSFYALTNPVSTFTLSHLAKVYKNRLPSGMLPIADDPAGNIFITELIAGKDFGKIYFLDHEQEADVERQPYFKNIHWITNNFNDFLLNLK
jgi:hypothetical protein